MTAASGKYCRVCLLVLLMVLPAAGGEPEAPGKVRTGFNAVWSDGANGAWAVSDLGVVAESFDHGQTWHVLASPVKTALLTVWRSPDGDLFVAGEKGIVGEDFMVLHSRDGGATFTESKVTAGR